MSNWNVLIIDDEAIENNDIDSRFQKYNLLCSQQYDSRGFKLTFARDTDHARIQLKQHDSEYDIVLLDVRLRRWGDDIQGTNFKELFRIASDRYLVALVSAYWDKSSMNLVRDFLLHNPDIDQPLFFTFKDFKLGGLAGLGTQIVTYIRRKRSLYSLEIQPQEPFNILHLSDLHFGLEGTAKTLAGIPDIDELCDKILAEWKQGPHIIAVTGDIGNTGHPNEYKMALKWFHVFSEKLGIRLPSPRLLLVPGNHDVSIPLAGAQQIRLAPDLGESAVKRELVLNTIDAKKNNPLSAYACQPFNEFAAKVSSTRGAWIGSSSPTGCWTEFGFIEYGVVFSGFNTSKQIDASSWPLRLIDDTDLDQVNKIFSERDVFSNNNGKLHVSLSHHSLMAYPDVREHADRESNNFLYNFLNKKYSPRLFLHGHQHRRWGAKPAGSKYFVISASSPSCLVREKDTPRAVNMISLERDGSCIKRILAKNLFCQEDGWCLSKLPGDANKFELSSCR